MNELEFSSIPELLTAYPGLLDCTGPELHSIVQQPTLIHLDGRRAPALFVSALLHGNESVGLHALQALLKKYQSTTLPRKLSFFLGNIAAAKAGVRRLENQPDYNRVWPGTSLPESYETKMMQSIVQKMQKRGVFASIDLHNNTGLNPHYACITSTAPEFLQLASLFGRTVVYFQTPAGVQTMAFAKFCPAVTCECGRVDDQSGIQHAFEFVDACLHLDAFPKHSVHAGDIHLFHTIASLKVPDHCSMSFNGADADIRFVPNLDHMNFVELDEGTVLADMQGPAQIVAIDDQNLDVSDELLQRNETQLTLKRKLMPAMLTLDENVIRQDCLGYLMERMGI